MTGTYAEFQAERSSKQALKSTYEWLGPNWKIEGLGGKTFKTFQRDRQAAAYDAALAYAQNPEGTLILYGPYGIGKSHLLAAICNDLTTREVAAIREYWLPITDEQRRNDPWGKLERKSEALHGSFTTAPMLFHAIGEHISTHESYTGLIRKAITTPLLVIDDIDKAKYSEFREEIYFDIIDGRVNAGRPIAISTNRLSDLAEYVGKACASRLSVGQIAIDMTGEDYRPSL